MALANAFPCELGSPVPPRRRGRPRIGSQKSRISVRLPDEVLDWLIQLASRHDVAVSAIARRVIIAAHATKATQHRA